jgi:hypothetical protein
MLLVLASTEDFVDAGDVPGLGWSTELNDHSAGCCSEPAGLNTQVLGSHSSGVGLRLMPVSAVTRSVRILLALRIDGARPD